MDVVHTRADLVGILVLLKALQQLRAGAGVLNRDHIRIHALDHPQHVVEFAVTHVGVNLGTVTHAGRCQPESVHGPLQVPGPIGAPQRQPFTQGGLIDLDDADAGGLEVDHLVPDGQRLIRSRALVGQIVVRRVPFLREKRNVHGALIAKYAIGGDALTSNNLIF